MGEIEDGTPQSPRGLTDRVLEKWETDNPGSRRVGPVIGAVRGMLDERDRGQLTDSEVLAAMTQLEQSDGKLSWAAHAILLQSIGAFGGDIGRPE